jgi:hypothetical protein
MRHQSCTTDRQRALLGHPKNMKLSSHVRVLGICILQIFVVVAIQLDAHSPGTLSFARERHDNSHK